MTDRAPTPLPDIAPPGGELGPAARGICLREEQEAWELANLMPYATKARHSKGRDRVVPECDIRTCFQRDRDRIVHSKAFRRLKHKTQVFVEPKGDHYRTRMTHTLEIMQIGRTVARALRLNEDLTEAAILGHDVGHTPFGHSGEAVLNRLAPFGFRHNLHSVRVVEVIEPLNLTWEVRDGIRNHSGNMKPGTQEGEIAKIADRVAYLNHDIDDAIRAGVMALADLPGHFLDVLGHTHGERIHTLTMSLIQASWRQEHIQMEPRVHETMLELRRWMFQHVYLGRAARREEAKIERVVEELYHYYHAHPDELAAAMDSPIPDGELTRKVVDYIAGMTDRYAIATYQKLFVPIPWPEEGVGS